MLPDSIELDQGDMPEICDANGRGLRIAGSVTLFVQVGSYHTHIAFYVCEKLTVPAILGCDFCDAHVEAIRPRSRSVELADGTIIPIIRKPGGKTTPVQLPPSLVFTEQSGRALTRLMVTNKTMLALQRQTRVKVVCQKGGTLALNTLESMFAKHRLATMNAIVDVEPEVPFDVIVANYGDYPITLLKGQVVANLDEFPDGIYDSNIALNDVLGLTADGEQIIEKIKAVEPTHLDGEELPPIPDLNDDHLPPVYRNDSVV